MRWTERNAGGFVERAARRLTRSAGEEDEGIAATGRVAGSTTIQR